MVLSNSTAGFLYDFKTLSFDCSILLQLPELYPNQRTYDMQKLEVKLHVMSTKTKLHIYIIMVSFHVVFSFSYAMPKSTNTRSLHRVICKEYFNVSEVPHHRLD